MESQVAEADTGNPLLRIIEVTRTAEGLVGRLNHFRNLDESISRSAPTPGQTGPDFLADR